MSVDALTEALFDAVYKAFQQKLDRITTAIYPFVKNVYETQGNRYKMIGVPFTDGVKTLHVGTDLEKAYNTQGRQVTLDFQKNLVLSITHGNSTCAIWTTCARVCVQPFTNRKTRCLSTSSRLTTCSRI